MAWAMDCGARAPAITFVVVFLWLCAAPVSDRSQWICGSAALSTMSATTRCAAQRQRHHLWVGVSGIAGGAANTSAIAPSWLLVDPVSSVIGFIRSHKQHDRTAGAG